MPLLFRQRQSNTVMAHSVGDGSDSESSTWCYGPMKHVDKVLAPLHVASQRVFDKPRPASSPSYMNNTGMIVNNTKNRGHRPTSSHHASTTTFGNRNHNRRPGGDNSGVLSLDAAVCKTNSHELRHRHKNEHYRKLQQQQQQQQQTLQQLLQPSSSLVTTVVVFG